MTNICNIRGVPLRTSTIPWESQLNGLNFAIVAKHMIKPRGKDMSKVRRKRKTELAKPLSNSNVIDMNSAILL